jgi:F420-non-reducing hydrogenase iron-sulfur subunit
MGNLGETSLQIAAFCCHYCAYAAADLAGVLRLQYPADIKILEIPCSGRLDALEVLHTFEHGADGVMVAACLEGDCHFQAGNLNAKRRVQQIKERLRAIGLEPDRLELYNLSSAMARQFADSAADIFKKVAELGPSPLRRGIDRS